MRIAIVHDFLKEYGGAERVLEVLHEMWPKAPVYTAFVDWEGLGPHADRMKKWQIVTSWAQKIPYIEKIYSPLRFLAPLFFESFDFSDFDLVISSTNAYYAKGIITHPGTFHLCYCHTPPRSLYGYQTRMDWQKNIFTRIYGMVVNHFLRKYDFLAAKRVDQFVANSETVRARIQKFYRKDSIVVYPPVELRGKKQEVRIKNRVINEKANSPKPTANSYYLYVGKLAVAKNVNLIIEAAIKEGFRVKIVGKGSSCSVIPSSKTARNLCQKQGLSEDNVRIPHFVRNDNGDEVEFLGEVSDEELVGLYENCKAVIFPAVDEDFGIVPVEAMNFGKPVIALRSGGVTETVVDGKTGVFFNTPSAESLIEAIKRLSRINIKSDDCIKQAQKFSKEEFKKKLLLILEKLVVKSD